jgi:hypothetical protein
VTRALVWLVVVSGCGRFGFGSHDGVDASHDDARLDDGASMSDTSTIDARPCGGTTHTITENFDDNLYNAALWGNAYDDNLTTYAETGGRLVINLGANSANDWAGYMTSTGYQLANDRVFVEVPQISSPGTNTVLLLATSQTASNGPSIESEVGRLEFRKRAGGAIMDLADVTYNAVEHRWWQIRDSNGRTYWELSRDGVSWTIGYEEPSAANTTAFITLVAGTNSAIASPGSAVFDNLNGGGAPPDCP